MPQSMSPSRRDLLAGAAVAATAVGAAQATGQRAYADGFSLEGNSILITGSSSGFGRLGAEHYARLGAKVFASMRNLPRPEADELETLAAAENLDITVIEIDVRSDAQVAAGVAQVLDATGGSLDVLINNAGIAYAGPVELQDMDAMQHTFDTNVFGCHRMARAVLPAMRTAGGGQIFNISSQLGRVIIPGLGAYSGTKFALEALSEQMAYEFAMDGIEVTIIQPGGYPTAIWENGSRYTQALFERTSEDQRNAYPSFTGQMSGGQQSTDPMDIPKAIAEIIDLPKGTRPLRRAVHPAARPQEGINAASAQTQLAMLGESPLGPAIKAVLD